MSIDQELAWLNDVGLRVTGNAAHEALIARVEKQWRELGLHVNSDVRTFTRWDLPEERAQALWVDGQPVKVASVFPYSGVTGPEGTSGRLVWLPGPVHRWRHAAGKIAVVPVENLRLPMRALVGTWFDAPPWPTTSNPLIPATIAGFDLHKAAAAGVKGVVFAWRGITEQEAAGQYVPFTFDYQGTPAVFVAGRHAQAMRNAAQRGATATLTLAASMLPDVVTRTLWATVPGTERPEETLLIVTHSDGTNMVEENGHIALVELAREVVARPPKRSVVFVLTTGHLRIPAMTSKGQATTRWLENHPEWWNGGSGQRRAVAGLALEHFGAREYAVHADGSYAPTGRIEPELLYANNAEMARLAQKHWAPGTAARISKPRPLIQFGEGEPLLQHGIPAISLITTPAYLLADIKGDLVDVAVMRRQIGDFKTLLRALDEAERSALGRVKPPGCLAKAANLIVLLGALAKSKIASAQHT